MNDEYVWGEVIKRVWYPEFTFILSPFYLAFAINYLVKFNYVTLSRYVASNFLW